MRLAFLALLLLPLVAAAQSDDDFDPSALGACAIAPPADSLVFAATGVYPPKRVRYFCADSDREMAGLEAPISSHIGPPGDGPEWRYTFLAPSDYAPPAGVLSCEEDTAYMGPPPEGYEREAYICRGESEAEGGIWALGMRYTRTSLAETGKALGASGILVVGYRVAGDG